MVKYVDKDIDELGFGTPGNSPVQTPADSMSPTDFFDQVLASQKHTEKEINKKHKEYKFPGLVLDSTKITAEDLRLRTSQDFYNYISRGNNLEEGVIEYRVHIKELTSYLPVPSLTDLGLYHTRATGAEQLTEQEISDAKKYGVSLTEHPANDRTLRRIKRFPCFYKSVKDGGKVDFMFTCKVKFLDQNRMFYGVMESIDKQIEILSISRELIRDINKDRVESLKSEISRAKRLATRTPEQIKKDEEAAAELRKLIERANTKESS